MTEQDIQFLKQHYKRLRAMYDAGQLDAQQLAAEVGKLQARDQWGNWWTLNPWDGSFLRYNGSQWTPDNPPQIQPQPENRPSPPTPQPSAVSAPDKKGWLPLVSLLGILLPIFTAFIWFAYTSLSPRSEGWDCLTPLIIAGVPVLLIMFQGPMDRLLRPLQPFRQKVPPALLLGLALAVPVIFGCICSSATYTGYGTLRFASVVGMLGAYALTRNPEVRS